MAKSPKPKEHDSQATGNTPSQEPPAPPQQSQQPTPPVTSPPEKEEPHRDPPPMEIPEEESKWVQVICEGTLGPELLEKGDITDDPAYVALLETERGRKLVRAVK